MDAIEKRIARRAVKALLDAGYEVAVDDGEEVTVPHCSDIDKIMAALGTTDMDWLIAFKNNNSYARAVLIWGNGEDVLSDYSTSLSDVLDPVNA